jgi:hypothetical protein
MPRPQWSARLARPIQVKGGPPLRTLHNARAFVLGLPDGIQDRQALIRGNPGKRPIRPEPEPEVPSNVPEPPKFLSGYAMDANGGAWRRSYTASAC